MTPFDDLAQLRVFVRIVESGSVSAAARVLRIPQPTLSRQLRLLEEQCGTVLLLRDTHGMSLTETGQRLYEDARRILELAEQATERVLGEQAAVRGHLRVFATTDFGQFAVTRMIARFIAKHPDLTVELKYSNRPARMIEEGFEVGIVVGEVVDDRVVARPAGKIVRYLTAAPDLVQKHGHPKLPEELHEWPWIALGGSQFGDPAKVVLHAPGTGERTIPITPVLISEGVTSIREAVRESLGIAVLPEWICRADIAAGKLVRVLPQWNAPELPVHVIYPSQRTLAARVRSFADFAVHYLMTESHTVE